MVLVGVGIVQNNVGSFASRTQPQILHTLLYVFSLVSIRFTIGPATPSHPQNPHRVKLIFCGCSVVGVTPWERRLCPHSLLALANLIFHISARFYGIMAMDAKGVCRRSGQAEWPGSEGRRRGQAARRTGTHAKMHITYAYRIVQM